MRLSSVGTGRGVGRTLLAIVVGLGLAVGRALSQEPGPRGADGAPHFVQVAAGEEHTCGLTGEGAAYCWGGNSYGELGAVTMGTCQREKARNPCSPQPVAVGGSQRFVSLSVGRLHSCGLTAEGVAYCWGDNTIGQLGFQSIAERCGEQEGGLPCSHVPVPVETDRRFTALAAARYHTCGLTTTGEVLCWGSNKAGQLGTSGPFDNCAEAMPGEPTWACVRRPASLAGNPNMLAIAAAPNHSCGLAADSTAYCWGEHYRSTPVQVSARDHFASISAGGRAACALTSDGRPFCWGLLFLLGDKLIGVREPGVQGGAEKSGLRFARLVVGELHYCGLTADGKVYCWGRGNEGQLGVKRGLGGLLSRERYSPNTILVEGVPVAVALAAGAVHTCAVTADGAVYCWGRNDFGQLGDGTVENRQTPTLVSPAPVERPRASAD